MNPILIDFSLNQLKLLFRKLFMMDSLVEIIKRTHLLFASREDIKSLIDTRNFAHLLNLILIYAML